MHFALIRRNRLIFIILYFRFQLSPSLVNDLQKTISQKWKIFCSIRHWTKYTATFHIGFSIHKYKYKRTKYEGIIRRIQTCKHDAIIEQNTLRVSNWIFAKKYSPLLGKISQNPIYYTQFRCKLSCILDVALIEIVYMVFPLPNVSSLKNDQKQY